MSGFIDLGPPPIRLGSMSSADTDGAFLVDATANMTRRGTTIAGVGAPAIQRQDGAAIGATDLIVTTQAPTGTGLGWTFKAQTRGATGVYLIGFPLALANGDAITRSVLIASIAALG